MKALIIGAVFILSFALFRDSAFAVNLSLENVPLAVEQNQEFEIKLNFSCIGCGDSYLRGVFYPSGSKYFGYTQDNSGVWSNASGGGCTTFFKVASQNLQSGSWSGTLKFKSDTQSSNYEGPGEYLFKVGRYTTSCNSPTWSTDSTIAITGPTSTPTQVPISITTVTTSTNTPSPTKTLTPTKSPTPTKTPTPIKENESSEENKADILGSSVEEEEEDKKVDVKVASSNTSITGTIFILAGIVFTILCGIVIFWPKINSYLNRNAENNNN